MVNPSARQVVVAVRDLGPGALSAQRTGTGSWLSKVAGFRTRRRAGRPPAVDDYRRAWETLRESARSALPEVACPAHRTSGRLGEGEIMQADVSAEAAELVRQHGGRMWVWAARSRVCCWGTPAYMHAATERPPGLSVFALVSQAGAGIWFRAPAGRVPDVLEIGLHGRRRPQARPTGTAARSGRDPRAPGRPSARRQPRRQRGELGCRDWCRQQLGPAAIQAVQAQPA
jgi:hypothetical protein